MTNFNPFLIHEQKNTIVQNPEPFKWVFEVQKDGILTADFLQTDKNLDVLVLLNGEGAKSKINCAYLSNKNNRLNIDIKVIHKVKNTFSEQKIKGLATDNSLVNFCGLIEIPHDSQKCDGRLNHRGVLLSSKASILAIPQLEIWADDVQCAHGSAVGPLDKNQLFYLQARGLNNFDATRLLLHSFLADVMPKDFESVIEKWMVENV